VPPDPACTPTPCHVCARIRNAASCLVALHASLFCILIDGPASRWRPCKCRTGCVAAGSPRGTLPRHLARQASELQSCRAGCVRAMHQHGPSLLLSCTPLTRLSDKAGSACELFRCSPSVSRGCVARVALRSRRWSDREPCHGSGVLDSSAKLGQSRTRALSVATLATCCIRACLSRDLERGAP
jgi:hypothetical protein